MDLFTIVLGVLAGVALLVAVGFVLSRVVLGNAARRARAKLPAAGPEDVEESAVGLTAPFRSYGLLRLTPGQLLFANGSGGSTTDVLSVPRSRIVACTASQDVPTGAGMQTLRRQALVVQLNDPSLPSGVGFMVTDPGSWVARIRG